MENILKTKRIYESAQLQNFILELEQNYRIENAEKKYHNLVNFSQNSSIPYHQWFRYREGFSGELIKELIAMSGILKDEIVLDPFCGSGTTNVVSFLLGYDTLGIDVNPMSAFITNTKVTHYTEHDIQVVKGHLSKINTWNQAEMKKGYEDIRKYFNENNFLKLVRIKTFIDLLPASKEKNILFVAFLSIIESCSDRKRDGNGLKKSLSKVEDVLIEFVNKVDLMLKDIQNHQAPQGTKGLGIYDSAFHLKDRVDEYVEKKHVGAIIFSPPYANSFDYFESYKMELVFGDFVDCMSGIAKLRNKAVRSFIGAAKQECCDAFVDEVAKEIENAIPAKEAATGKKDARTRKVPDMLRGYFSDMREVIRQCSNCLERGGKTYIVVDQSSYLGKIVPTDLFFAYFAEKESFHVNRIIECRKARTSTQQLQKYPYLKNCLRESIVELVKK